MYGITFAELRAQYEIQLKIFSGVAGWGGGWDQDLFLLSFRGSPGSVSGAPHTAGPNHEFSDNFMKNQVTRGKKFSETIFLVKRSSYGSSTKVARKI